MKTAKYNGWANRDTWLVALWLSNDERNYRYVVANKKRLVAMKKAGLFMALRRLHFGDKVVWGNVNSTEIKQSIREM